MVWDPNQYLKFKDHRLRPALDLLQRIPDFKQRTIVDLGCGTGIVTKHIVSRWPNAEVVGLDTSLEMLEQAESEVPESRFMQADAATWSPSSSVDLIYSNAALHWLPDHNLLIPKLIDQLSPNGILAVQMPRNFNRPTHTLVNDVAKDGPWREVLEPMLKPHPTHEPDFYYDLLADKCDQIDLWESDYIQVLEGPNPVAEWTKGTWLRPFLVALTEPHRSEFEAVYRERILQAYPPRPDGKTLLPFRRLFFIAQRS